MSLKKYLNISTFANTTAEKHSLGIGAFVGMTVALAGGKDAAWLFIMLAGVAFGARKVSVGHLQDVRSEPAYALGAATASFLFTVFVVVPRLSGGVLFL